MTLLNNNIPGSKDINIALLSLETDIKNKMAGLDTSAIDRQLVEINNRIDKINTGSSSAVINDIRTEIEGINSQLDGTSTKIENLEQNIEGINTQIEGIEQKLSDIFSAESLVTDFNTTTDAGIYYWNDASTNKPNVSYGVLLVNKAVVDDINVWINQIAYGTNGRIYFRQKINNANWTEWKAVAFEGEITANKVVNELTVNGKTYDGSSAVNAGVQTVANGGTGATTEKGAFMNLANGLSEGSGPLDTECMIYKNTSGTNWGLYTLSHFWEYIKDKISSVLGVTKDNYGGKASTAGNADTVDSYHASALWRSDGATWNPGADVALKAAANNSEWSFDISRNGYTGCYWHVWDSTLGTLLRVNADDGKVSTPYGLSSKGKVEVGGSGVGGAKIVIQGNTVSSNSYADTNPKLEFKNTDGSQNISLTFTDYDAVKAPASLTLNGNQGNEFFIAPCIKASNKLVIPIGAPDTLEDGCIWIER